MLIWARVAVVKLVERRWRQDKFDGKNYQADLFFPIYISISIY
jgi:hypothetical protein